MEEGIGAGPHKSLYTNGELYTVVEEGACNLCAFPIQQAEQKESFFIEYGILQCWNTKRMTFAFGWPSLRCHLYCELGVFTIEETDSLTTLLDKLVTKQEERGDPGG